MDLKIGILLPQSFRYPLMSHQFASGVRSCAPLFEAANVELVIREFGTSSDRQTMEAANSLMLNDQVDVVTGVFSETIMPELHKLFNQLQLPLLASNVGARIPYPNTDSKYVLVNTLHLWQSCYELGRWAVEQFGKKVLMCTSFYDGGYSIGFAFSQGVESAGGEVNGYYITPKIPWENSAEVLQSKIKETKPDFLFAGFNGEEAVRFLEDLEKVEASRKLAVVGSPYLVDESILDEHGQRASGIHSAFSWSATLEAEGNSAFVAAFKSHTRRNPDGFAVLGYETALMLAEALSAGGMDNAKSLAETLRQVAISGPRGTLSIDAASGRTNSSIWLRVVDSSNGVPHNRMVKPLGDSMAAHMQLKQHGGAESGWLNPYLSG